MKILLVFNWTSTQEPGVEGETFYKLVSMPTCPSIGTELTLWSDVEGDNLFEEPCIVRKVVWDEVYYKEFELHLSEELDMTPKEAEQVMRDAGWMSGDRPGHIEYDQ